MKGRQRTGNIVSGFGVSFYYSVIIALLLLLVIIVYSIIVRQNLVKGVYTAYYYCGAFILIFSIPQFYRRNRNVKAVQGKLFLFGNPDTGGENWNAAGYRSDGFWRGILIAFVSVMLFIYAFVIENIYFYMGG